MDDLPDFRVSPDENSDAALRLRRAERAKKERVEQRAQAHFAAMTKAEQDAIAAKHAEAQRKVQEAHLAALKAQARAAWPGDDATFNKAWPQILEDTLRAEMAQRQADYQRDVRERHPFEL
jgi:hypothetical protein